jgi:hypothetical protein
VKIRLILKVPRSAQTSPDTWQDTTTFATFDLPMPAKLYGYFSGTWTAVVVGAEVIDDAAHAPRPEGEVAP